jgi:response regulator RpfG family c-di-GMP phosphodiesterase
LAARIVAIADVFDALSSRRVYKDAWIEDDVLKEMKSQAGKQFDPELIEIFFEILPQIRAIQKTWPEL